MRYHTPQNVSSTLSDAFVSVSQYGFYHLAVAKRAKFGYYDLACYCFFIFTLPSL